MSTLLQLLSRLEERGIQLWSEDGRLRFRGPEGALTPELRTDVRAHKEEILTFLAGAAPEAEEGPPLEPLAPDVPPPLSFAQERLWFLDQFAEGNAAEYNEPSASDLLGRLEPPALAGAFAAVVARHDALRSRFPLHDGAPRLVVGAPTSPPLPEVDLRALPEAARTRELHRRSAEEAQRPFDLATGPVLRLTLVRVTAEHHRLLLTLHHIVSDGWSAAVLLREVAEVYGALLTGRPADLPPLPVQYPDYAAWQRRVLRKDVLEQHLAWWRQALRELSAAPLELPFDRPRPPHDGGAAGMLTWAPGAPLFESVERLARNSGASLYMVLLAAFGTLVARLSGRRDLALGSPVANRPRPELEQLIGLFVNTLVLRLDLQGDPTFGEILHRTRATTLAALEHQEVPFEKLVEALGVERSLGHSPFFQVLFGLDNTPHTAFALPGLRLLPAAVSTARAKFDLTFLLTVSGTDAEQRMTGRLEYRLDLFDPTTVRRLLGQLEVLLGAVGDDPECPVEALPLLTAGERHQLLRAWNDRPAVYDRQASVHALVAGQGRVRAEAVAVVGHDDAHLSWQQLLTDARRLRHALHRRGVRPGARVAVCLERRPRRIVALLGILQVGAAYVPLAPGDPTQRLAFVLEDAAPQAVLTEQNLVDKLPQKPGCPVLLFEDLRMEPEGATLPTDPVDGDWPAYLTYTSGTTGRPKGVVVPHRGVVRLVCGARWVHLSAEETFLQISPLAFDVSVFEIWGALLSGGRLVLLRPGLPALEELGTFLRRQRISTLWLTAGLFNLLVDERLDDLAGAGQILAGGEALSVPHVEAARRALPGRLLNGYGPTENTTFSTTHTIPRGAHFASSVPIGRPIEGSRAHVLDARLRAVPAGVAGELWVGGDGLAQGYAGRGALTATRFVPDPFTGSGERLYGTGDRARTLPGGEIEFLGRIDHQVKLRGYRIEPGEVETALMEQQGVREAVVVLRRDGGAARLVAYLTAEDTAPETPQLRRLLTERVPAYMVPSAWVVLDHLPRTANNKIDRRRLPAPDDAPARDASAPPRTPAEELIAGLFTELLSVPRVDRETSFFALGGQSLLAIRLVSRLRTLFECDLPVRAVFESPTVAGLATLCTSQDDAFQDSGAGSPPLIPPPPGEDPVLSFAQERLWFLDQLEGHYSHAYNVPVALALTGPLAVAPLANALASLEERHLALRSRFPKQGGRPELQFNPPRPADLPTVDLTALPPGIREAEEGRQLRHQGLRPFSLAHGPLLRSLLLRREAHHHTLLLVFHHIVCDAVSCEIFCSELAALYADATAELPPLPLEYHDFARWQRSLVADGEGLALAAWKQRLAGLPPLNLPTDRPRPPFQSTHGTQLTFTVPPDLADALRRLSLAHGTTLFMTLLTSWGALLSRASGQFDFAVGSPVTQRRHRETEGLIGFFVETLVLRLDLGGRPTGADGLARVRRRALEAYDLGEMPFEKLVAELEPQRDPSRSPLFQAMLSWQGDIGPLPTFPRLHLEVLELTGDVAKFDLSLAVGERSNGLGGSLEFNTDLFDHTTAARHLKHFHHLLTALVNDPATPLADLPILGAAERAELARWEVGAPLPQPEEPLLHHLFEDQAARSPEAIALVFEGREMTYATLNQRADQLAQHLQKRWRVGPEVRVALLAERGFEMLIGLLGILKAGGVYLPLDPQNPAERLNFLVRDADAALVLLTDEELAADLPRTDSPLQIEVVGRVLGTPSSALSEAGLHSPVPRAENLAYVLYTSGSTGRPKAVAVTHRAIVHHMRWQQGEAPADSATRILQKTTLVFDVSLCEIFGPLQAGGCLVIAPSGEERDPAALIDRARAQQVNALHLPPALLQAVLELDTFDDLRLHHVFCGGEAIPSALAARFVDRTGISLLCCYGPTESAIDSTFHQVRPGAKAAPTTFVPLGRPLSGLVARVQDRCGRPVPLGFPGELVILGPSLARGYLGHSALTAERFVPAEGGERSYRTGDLVRRLADGTIEFLGRIDHQVKIRGIRIELGEVEAALREHPEVVDAVAAVRPLAGSVQLVAAWQPRRPQAEGDLRAYLTARLPDAMVPTLLFPLDPLPRTPNGKTDRAAVVNAASHLADAQLNVDGPSVPLASPTEQTVAETVADLLRLPTQVRSSLGGDSHFFALGGHSLLAAQLISRLTRATGVELPLRTVFENPRLADLARRLDEEQTDHRPAPPPLTPRPAGDGPLLLSFAQERLWFLDQLDPGTSTYNLPAALRLRGPLRVDALAGALHTIAERHETLRTTFSNHAGEPRQEIHPHPQGTLLRVDLTGLSTHHRRVQDQLQRLADHPFQLDEGPLIRTVLLHLDTDDHLLYLDLHHIISDGWSMGVLTRELGVLYRAACTGAPSPLSPLPVQFADYVHWQRQWLRGDVLERQLAYWRQELADLRPLELPTDFPRPPVQSLRGGAHTLRLPAALTTGLHSLAHSSGTTLFTVLLTAFQALLARITHQSDLTVGTPVAHRTQPEMEPLIGFFVNTLVLRGDLTANPTGEEFLTRLHTTVLAALAHQDVPFERLVMELETLRDQSRSPLFQVLLVLENTPFEALHMSGLRLEGIPVSTATAKFDLTLFFTEAPTGELLGRLEYNLDLFHPTTAQRLAGHFTTLLQGLQEQPQQPLSTLPLLTPSERQALLIEGGATHRLRTEPSLKITSLPERFAARLPAHAERISWELDGRALSYRELNHRAQHLAAHLMAAGAVREELVGLCLPRSSDLPVAILGILQAGGAYVPLDPAYPQERLAAILQEAAIRLVVTCRKGLDKLPQGTHRTLLLEETTKPPEAQDSSVGIPAKPHPDQLAYVIYTSGSTGRPKGVAVTHRNVLRLFNATARHYHFGPEDVWPLFHSFAFDVSVWELWGALLHGGRLLSVPYLLSRSPEEFYHSLRSRRVTVLNQTPSAFRQLTTALEADGPKPQALRWIIFAGEALDFRSLRPWHRHHLEAGPQLANMYGITETTVHVTFRTVEPHDIEHPRGSFVGPAMDDLTLHLLDRHGHPVPLGVPGELHVGGPGLARGYLRRPGLTASRFVPAPNAQHPGARLYRSGDLARLRSDGELESLGRIDHQVKVRGFRIELGDLEARMLEYESIAEAVALARPLVDDTPELIAYFVPRHPLNLGALRQHLAEGLPEYMLPAHLVPLEGLPMTRNGKVDRRALPDPTPSRAGTQRVPPRTSTEAVLVDIFQEVLGRRNLGVHDHFFALGGHSLKVTKAVSRIRQRLQVRLGPREVFAHPTAAGLAREVAAARRVVQPPIPRLPDGPDFAPSHAQRRLWILGRLAPDSITYNLVGALRLRGPLNAEAFGAALGDLVERHEALRTTFPSIEGEPRQRILPSSAFRLEVLYANDLDMARGLIDELAHTAFHLEEDLLFRARLLRLDSEDHLFAYNLHHIVSDGWSLGVMERELGEHYRRRIHSPRTADPSVLTGPSAPEPDGVPPQEESTPPNHLPLQYRDYAAWQNTWLSDEASAATRDFWHRELTAPLPILELSTDRPHRPVKSFTGGALTVSLGVALEEALTHLALSRGASLFMTLMTSVATVLHHHSGQTDLILGFPVAGRDHPDLEHQIGFYVNSLPLRIHLAPEEPVLTLLERVKDTITGALEHGSYPFDLLVEELKVERDPARSPVFEVMVALQNQEATGLDLGDVQVEPLETHLAVSRFELTFNFHPRPAGLALSIEYNSDLFDTTRITRLAGQLGRLLRELTENPKQTVGGLSLLGRAERHQLLREWNDTDAPYPRNNTLQSQVAAHAARAPHRIALEFEDSMLTYGELLHRARRLAARLAAQGLHPEEPVALFMDRSLELIIAMVGILEAGGAYLPLDPNYPAKRLRFMLESLGVRQVLSQDALVGNLPIEGLAVLSLNAYPDPPVAMGADDTVIFPEAMDRGTSEAVAYVMFTSGSTGQPKGVRVLHRGITRLAHSTNFNRFPFDRRASAGRHSHLATIAFDASTEEIWSALLNGATLCISPPNLPSLEELGAFMVRRRLTYVCLTTSLFIEMVQHQENALRNLRTLALGGDVLPAATARAARTNLPNCQVVNLYGPTEGSVAVTAHPLPESVRSPVPIGRVLTNNQIYLLTSDLRPVPLGIPGELHLGGDGLARDYQDRPAVTAEHFLPNPLSGLPGARLYKTGDLARQLADGEIEFLGRVDQQVKVSGYRIELGEIEAHLRTFPGLRDAVVIAPATEGFGRRLVAFFTSEGADLSVQDLRDHLGSTLPRHMVPAHLLPLDTLPFTPNRKLDRAALTRRALDHLQGPQHGGETSPRSAEPQAGLEQQLAAIWREVLGIASVGVGDNFFDLGGHSLAALKAHEQIRRDLGYEIPLVKLFEHPTLAALARHLKASTDTQNRPAPPADDSRARGRNRREMLKQQRPPRRRPR